MDKREFLREFTSSGIKLFDSEDNFVCKVNAHDISAGGVLVVSHSLEEFDAFNPGDEVKFQLSIPTGEVMGTAEVVWVDPEDSRMGLKFKQILKGTSSFMDFIANGFF